MILPNPLKKQPLPEGVRQIPPTSLQSMHQPIQQLVGRTFEGIPLLRLLLQEQFTATRLQGCSGRAPAQHEPMGLGIEACTLSLELAQGQMIECITQGLLPPKPTAVGSEQRQLSFS